MIDADAFNAFEAAGWADLGAWYHRHSGPLTQRLVEPLLDAAGVRSGTRVLDVATGPGYAAAACVARGASAVGLDLSPAMLELARSLHPELELVEGDVERLPFPDAPSTRRSGTSSSCTSVGPSRRRASSCACSGREAASR